MAVLAVLVVMAWPAAPAVAAPPPVAAAGAVLWDPADARVLYGRSETVGRPMASTTKIMTALLAYETGAADGSLRVSPAVASAGATTGAATVGLRAGEVVPVSSVLAGLLLRSGNDAAVAVAEHVAGSEAVFVQRMNERATQLGLADTLFLDASGLSNDPRHQAAPLDLARLAEVAMRDPRFVDLVGDERRTVPVLGALENRNLLLGAFAGATGVKTGFTRLAGNCLVGSATRDGRTLYAVVLASPDSFAETAALLRHGFTDFRRVRPLRPGAPAPRYRWAEAAVDVTATGELGATVPADETATWRTVWDPVVERPAAQGTPLGRAELVVAGRVRSTVPLVAAEAVPQAAPGPPPATVGSAVEEAVRAFVRTAPLERAA